MLIRKVEKDNLSEKGIRSRIGEENWHDSSALRQVLECSLGKRLGQTPFRDELSSPPSKVLLMGFLKALYMLIHSTFRKLLTKHLIISDSTISIDIIKLECPSEFLIQSTSTCHT